MAENQYKNDRDNEDYNREYELARGGSEGTDIRDAIDRLFVPWESPAEEAGRRDGIADRNEYGRK